MPAAGYLWVEGNYLCYTDSGGNKRGEVGWDTGLNATAGGYIWIQANRIYYSDSSNNVRRLPVEALSQVAAAGYLWVEENWVHFIRQTPAAEARWHTNVPHGNIPHTNSHSNYPDHNDHDDWDDWEDWDDHDDAIP